MNLDFILCFRYDDNFLITPDFVIGVDEKKFASASVIHANVLNSFADSIPEYST